MAIKSKVKSYKLQSWAVVSSAALFFCYQYILRVSPNIMNEEIMQTYHIDSAAFGIMIGFYFWAYACMQLPLGILMDRLGSRNLMSLAPLLCGIACFLIANTTSFFAGSVSWFLIGLGSACGFLGCLKLGTLWLPPKDMGKVIAVTMTLGTLGATLGGKPLSYMMDNSGFETTLQILGIVGIAIAALIFIVVKNQPPRHPHHDCLDVYRSEHPFHDLRLLIGNFQAWIIAIYSMLMYAPITILGVGFGVPFLERAYDIDEKQAALMISSMFIGAAVGSPVFSLLSDFFRQRRLPMLLGTAILLLSFVAIIFIRDIPITIMYGLLFIAGFAYTAKGLSFASITELMPRNMSGTSIAFVNMAVMANGAIFLPLVGYLLKMYWDGQYIDGYPLYSEEDYRFALSVIPVILIIGTFLASIIKETHPEFGENKKFTPVLDADVV